ncbi:MAG: rhodanese-like domain-containing protein [Gammaproteobacteria bacterium]
MKRWYLFAALALLMVSPFARSAPVLVETEWLAERLEDPSLVIVDMSGDQMQYQRFHIPGAVHLPYRALVQRNKKGVSLRVPDARLIAILGQLGISRSSHVVVYDDTGGLNAGRLFWELERIGHPEVSVLDGGLVKWILEGRPVDNRWYQNRPTTYQLADYGGRDNEIDIDGVKRSAARGEARLLDVRTREEYVGDPRAKRSGHIPGASWWPWDGSVDFERGFRYKPTDEILAGLKAVGVTDRKAPVVVYCRSGHRASQSYLTLRSLGFENVRLYDGSMLEYEQDRGAPLQTGTAPGDGRDACREC